MVLSGGDIVRAATGPVFPVSLAAGMTVADRIHAASAPSCRHPVAGHRADHRNSMRKSGTHRRSCRRWSSAHATDRRLSWHLPKSGHQPIHPTPDKPVRRCDGLMGSVTCACPAALRMALPSPDAPRVGCRASKRSDANVKGYALQASLARSHCRTNGDRPARASTSKSLSSANRMTNSNAPGQTDRNASETKTHFKPPSMTGIASRVHAT